MEGAGAFGAANIIVHRNIPRNCMSQKCQNGARNGYLGVPIMQVLLDNPAWSALTTAQSAFAVGNDGAKRYRKGVLPFAALGPEGRAADLDALIDAGEQFYLIGELPELPANWMLESELPCAQLIGPEDIGEMPPVNDEIVYLDEGDKMEMLEFIS